MNRFRDTTQYDDQSVLKTQLNTLSSEADLPFLVGEANNGKRLLFELASGSVYLGDLEPSTKYDLAIRVANRNGNNNGKRVSTRRQITSWRCYEGLCPEDMVSQIIITSVTQSILDSYISPSPTNKKGVKKK